MDFKNNFPYNKSARAGTKMAAKKELVLRAPLQEKARKNSHKKESIEGRFQKKEASKKIPEKGTTS